MIRRAIIATSCLLVAGFVGSWLVAGALIAPIPRVVGDPPRELDATAFTVDSDSGSLDFGRHTQPK